MDPLTLISKYASWLYLLCALGVLLCLRAAEGARRERNASLFTLEREGASRKARRAMGLMVVVLLVAGATAFVDFSLPQGSPSQHSTTITPIILPTATHTSPLATPTPAEPSPTATRPPRPTPVATETPTPAPTPSSPPPSACDPRVSIVQPAMGAQVRGVVEIRGTADIENFQYYKLEFATEASPTEWRWIGEGKEKVVDSVLLSWDVSGLPAGGYFLRLMAVDKTGNYPVIPCQIEVIVE